MSYSASTEVIAPPRVSKSPRESPDQRLTVSIYESEDWPEVEPVWAELAKSSPYSSFYLSPEWIATWLQIFGRSLAVKLLVFRKQTQNIGVCLLTRSVERRGPFSVHRMNLNTGGEGLADRTLTEFNNLICLPGSETEVARELGRYVNRQPWDEFAIQGMCLGPVFTALQNETFPTSHSSVRVLPTFYVDLDSLRASGKSYLDSLSSNTRAQIAV